MTLQKDRVLKDQTAEFDIHHPGEPLIHPTEPLIQELDQIIKESLIVPVFQPIVDLTTGEVVAYEALARGPAGSQLETPDRLFELARASGRIAALDWICKTNSIAAANAARMRPPLTLFINAEPDTLGSTMPVSFAGHWIEAKMSYLELMFELTERAVASDPAGMLVNIDHFRSFHWSVALDDVGAEPESLGMLPFIRPDVIKLDMSLIAERRSADATEVIMAVNAEAERSGAIVLAEGIESPEHLARAKSFGARLGQGWHLGRPGPLPSPLPKPLQLSFQKRPRTESLDSSPFQRLVRDRTPRKAKAAEVLSLSRHLERRAARVPYPAVVIAGFQHADRYIGATRRIYEELSTRSPLVILAAQGMPDSMGSRIRNIPLDRDDPVASEWFVSVISPYWAGMMCATETDPTDPSLDRELDMILTFDRELAIEAAATLLPRLVGSEGPSASGEEQVHMAAALAQAIAESDRVGDLVRPLLELMSKVTGLKTTFLSKISEDNYDIVVSHNSEAPLIEEGAQLPWSHAVCKSALDVGKNSFKDVQNELPENQIAKDLGFRTFVTCPIVAEDGKVVGTLCGASDDVTGVPEHKVETVRAFAQLIGSHLEDIQPSAPPKPGPLRRVGAEQARRASSS